MIEPTEQPELEKLLEFWTSRREGAWLPARGDFLAEDFRRWFGHISILRVDRAPLRFFVTLCGTEVCEADGQDYTRRYIDEVLPAERRGLAIAGYETVVRTGKPHRDRLSAKTKYGRPILRTRLLLPCASDGELVDCILACTYDLEAPTLHRAASR